MLIFLFANWNFIGYLQSIPYHYYTLEGGTLTFQRKEAQFKDGRLSGLIFSLGGWY